MPVHFTFSPLFVNTSKLGIPCSFQFPFIFNSSIIIRKKNPHLLLPAFRNLLFNLVARINLVLSPTYTHWKVHSTLF